MAKVAAKTKAKTKETGRLGKTEIVKIVAQKTGMTQRDVAEVFNAYVDTTKEALVQGRPVGIPELGSFQIKVIPARIAIKSGTADATEIPESRRIQFRVSSVLKAELGAQ